VIIRFILFGLVAAGLAGFGMIAWVMMPPSNSAAAAVQVAHKILVLTATHALHPGTLLKPEDLASSEIDEARLPPGFVADEGDARRALIGGLVRHQVSAGDVLRLPGDALRPADHGFLAAVLAPGTRAVTVAVDVVSGAAGLIWPGDRVDLILTQTLDDPGQAAGHKIAAETVIRDARVIAIDQQIVKGTSQSPGDATNVAKTVTLEVTPNKAEFVQVASRLGLLSLTLRASDAGSFDEPAPVTTWASDVSKALPSQRVQNPWSTIRVFQGSTEGREYKF
jgi:pilus assembly protein CpaB